MALSKILWNDDVERVSYGFGFRKPKNPLSPFVPEPDDSLRVGIDNGIGCVPYERSVEPIDSGVHGIAS
jgi:hypothetical protein